MLKGKAAMRVRENTEYSLSENITGAESGVCRFRCLFGEEEAQFFFDVSDTEIVSPFREDNEDIWKGDAVEVFLSPDGDLSRYYELEVSPHGVRFWSVNRWSRGVRTLEKLPPRFRAHTERTRQGYRAEIALPLSELSGFDREKMRLNAFCVDKRENGEQLLYALFPTRCKTFHKPQFLTEIRSNAAREDGKRKEI